MSYFIKYGCGMNTETVSPPLHSCQVTADTNNRLFWGWGEGEEKQSFQYYKPGIHP